MTETSTEASTETSTDAQAPTAERYAIVAGLERLIGLIRLLTPAGEISLTTASTLARLSAAGPHRLSDLAAREGVTQPAMTQLVSRLERNGLAERRGDTDDRRVVMVHITPAGQQLLDQRRKQRAIQLSGLLDELSGDEEHSIATALPALNKLVDLGAPVTGLRPLGPLAPLNDR